MRLDGRFAVDIIPSCVQEFDPQNENLFRSTFVWVSPKDTVTPLHCKMDARALWQPPLENVLDTLVVRTCNECT